ncbi:MAG: class II aldolase and adducin N-terminal domain-containing protein [Hyphomicrobiales bacterium]
MSTASATPFPRNVPEHYKERVDLACAFRWTERFDFHESVANHFSLAVNDDGSQFLINANLMHFRRIKASNLLLLDANDPETLDRPDAPDATAWGLHAPLHRNVPHARCAIHVHSTYATVLASLQDSTLPPIDQNTAMFFERYVIDNEFGGLAFESEGERCASMFEDPKKKIMIMGNHGLLVIGETVAEAFHLMYYFERAAENYIKAKWTGEPLRVMSDELARKVAGEIESYAPFSRHHFGELKAILDEEDPSFRD